MVKDLTFYNILEVSPDASEDDIKKSAKKLMIKWHPDKHPNNVAEATKKFQEIQEASAVLTNPEKRSLYDQFGMDAAKNDGPPQEHFNPFGGGFPFPFGGGFPFGGVNVQRQEEKENVMEKIQVSLEQLYNNETVNIKYNHKVYCVKCNGEGTNDGTKSTCQGCGGKGMRVQVIRMGPMIQQQVGPCGDCRGRGKTTPDKNKCEDCNGIGMINKEKVLPIPMSAKYRNGIKLHITGKGHQFKDGKSDLVVIIEEKEHPKFKRNNNDLLVEVNLKLYQALFGFNKVIEHLDKRKLHLHCTGKTNFGCMRQIKGEGLKYDNIKGDLIIKFNIELPTITNETLIKAITLIDRNEMNNEKNIEKEENLVKTVMEDINTYKKADNKDYADEDEQNEQEGHNVQCAHQ